MNRREFVSGLTAAAAFAGAAPTAAAAEGRRVALVIGNGAYGNVPALLNPPNDASDIAAALKRLGFTVSLATNASFDEMRREARRALARIAAETDPRDDDEIALALQVRDEQGTQVYNICLSIKGNRPAH